MSRTGERDEGFPLSSRTVWRSALIIMLLAAGLAIVGQSDVVHAAIASALEASRMIIVGHPVAGPLLFVALAAVSAMLAFASVAVLLPLAIVTWGEPASVLLLWIGWQIGGACTYMTGRYFGRVMARWLAARSLLKRLERHLGPTTPFGVVLLFQLALPSEIPGYVLGLVRYSFRRYLLALALVELLYTVAAVHLGASFVERRGGMVVTTGCAVAVLSVLAFYFLRRKISNPAVGDEPSSSPDAEPGS